MVNNATITNDYAMCYGIGGNFATTFGGGDFDWMLDTSGEAVNASARLANMGITMDNAAAMGMLFGAPGDDLITGLLEISDDKTDNGAAKFLDYMAAATDGCHGRYRHSRPNHAWSSRSVGPETLMAPPRCRWFSSAATVHDRLPLRQHDLWC